MKTLTVNNATVTITNKQLKVNNSLLDIQFNNFEYHDLTYLSATKKFVIAGIDISKEGISYLTYIYINNQLLIETIKQEKAKIGVRDIVLLASEKGLTVILTVMNQEYNEYELFIYKKEYDSNTPSNIRDVYFDVIPLKFLHN